MQPTPPTSLAYSLSRPNKRVLLAFVVFGLVAGLLLVIDSERYDRDIFKALTQGMNYPTIIALLSIFGENFSIPVPFLIWDAVIVLITITVWTLIGFIVYCFYKVFTSRAID